MDAARLAALVRQMREAQRRYFRTRSAVDLAWAKNCETAVDRECGLLLDPQGPGLFDDTKGAGHDDSTTGRPDA